MSPAARVGAGYQHVGAKAFGSHFVSIRLTSAEFIHFHCSATDECSNSQVDVCVCVFMDELLTEVTLGLFLHSGDGTVLVCEEKLLELGHLIL